MNWILKHSKRSGYSLAEVLVATTILMVGVGAAASLTLSINTQEEIAWRVSRGVNVLETAAILYQQGIDASTVNKLIPLDDAVDLTAITAGEADETVVGVGVVRGLTFEVDISTVEDEGSWSAGTWTGGSSGALPVRTIQARAYRSTIDLY